MKKKLDKFSEKAIQSLNGYYVYALIDPRTEKVFYIGKGIDNRVFSHEIESGKSENYEKMKLQTIRSIEDAGLNVKRVIVNWGLTEKEAFVAEASLINLMNFTKDINLTNIVSGHSVHEALSVEDFDMLYGAEVLKEEDIKDSILVIKINGLYKRGMSEEELYEATRGVWRISIKTIKKQKVKYVFAVYNQLIVAVYKPDEWHRVYENIDLPREETLNVDDAKDRGYFICHNYKEMDDRQKFYLHKSISNFDKIKKAQYPTTYLEPKN